MLAMGLRVGNQLLILPLVLRFVPEQELGLYYTFVTLTGFVMMLDFGLATAITRNATYAFGGAKSLRGLGLPDADHTGEANWGLFAELMDTARRLFLWIGILASVLLLTLGTWYLYGLMEKSHLPVSLLWCWGIFALGQVGTFCTSYWNDLLAGLGRMSECGWIQIVSQLCTLVCMVVLLLVGAKLWAFAISGVVTLVVSRLLCARYLRMHAREAFGEVVRKGAWREIMRNLWPMVWRQGLMVVGAFLIYRASFMICASQLGLAAVAAYGMTMQVINLIVQMGGIPLTVKQPEIARLRVQRKTAEVRRIFLQRFWVSFGLMVVGFGMLASVGPWLLEWFAKSSRLIDFLPLCVLCVVMLLDASHGMFATLLYSMNVNFFVVPALVSGIAIVSLSWLVLPLWQSGVIVPAFLRGENPILAMILVQGIVQLCWHNWWCVWRGWQTLRVEKI